MYQLIVFLPLIGAILAGLLGTNAFRMMGSTIDTHGHGHGDLHVQVTVEVPHKLTAEQRAKLAEFADLCDESVNPRSKSFFDKAKGLFR